MDNEKYKVKNWPFFLLLGLEKLENNHQQSQQTEPGRDHPHQGRETSRLEDRRH